LTPALSLAKSDKIGERVPQDLDLALLTRDQPVWKLRDAITEALGSKRLDLVDLKRASPVLLFEILRLGNLLYSSDEATREHLSQRWIIERGLIAGASIIFDVADHILIADF
jgi:hypothetical protein